MLELRRDLARVCQGDIISVLPPCKPLLAGAGSILIYLKPSVPAFRQPWGTLMVKRKPSGVSALGDALPAPVHPRAALPLPAPLGQGRRSAALPSFHLAFPLFKRNAWPLALGLGEEQLVSAAGLPPDVITSGSATLHIFSSLKWRDRGRQIRSAALGDGIVSNKPCMTQSFHFKWGMKLLHPLTACSMKEIYLHLIALDPKRLCTVISRR